MSEKRNIVKETAKALGITQKELAERIGVSDGTIRNWSAGKKIPRWAGKSMVLLLEQEKTLAELTAIKSSCKPIFECFLWDLEAIAKKMTMIESVHEAKKVEKEMGEFYRNNDILPHFIVRGLYELSSFLVLEQHRIERSQKRKTKQQKEK